MIAQLLGFDLAVLGWAVLHLAWQGLLLGFAAELALWSLRHAAPRHREAVAASALLLMAGLFAVNAVRMTLVALEVGPASLASAAVLTPPGLTALAPWLGAAWLLGLALHLARVATGVAAARRLRIEARPAPGNALAAVATRMGIVAPPSLLSSERIEVPCLVGWAHPAILVPAGAPVDDAILAHELAHFARRDPWSRAAAQILRSLLFFHPVARRLHSRLDAERELACDDRAAEACGSPARYARALAALERARPPGTAPGIAADGAPLLARVRRLVAPGPRLPQRSARALTWAGAAGAFVLAFAVTQWPHPPGPALPAALAQPILQHKGRGILDDPVDDTRIQIKDVRRRHHS